MAAKQQEIQKVLLYWDQEIGHGAYGKVCKGECDGMPCAAKILHPMLCSELNAGSENLLSKFQQECDRMNRFNNPYIVQCFGTYQDPETNQLVLLMELMDKSLTKFLEQSSHCPLPYYLQVNICNDIALALAYLHSYDIVHRDLSSNNVLLIGNGSRAKVTDFGMSKINPHCRSSTLSPGCLVYMPPEALASGCYDEKLDIFSFGVLAIQIMTRKSPQHMGDSAERRKSHIKLVDPEHPLLSLAIKCLKDKPQKRPSAKELCTQLAQLKKSQQYQESERGQDWMIEKELQKALQVKNEEITRLNHNLHCAHDMIRELKDELEAKNSTLLLLERELRFKSSSWFHGKISLAMAHERLENSRFQGAYLVSECKVSGDFCLSIGVYTEGGEYHVVDYKIKSEGDHYYLADISTPFESLDAMVDHYSCSSHPLPDGRHFLQQPICPPDNKAPGKRRRSSTRA